MVLAEIEHRVGKPIAECFDLLAGTSTGGVIALGLATADPNNKSKPRYTAKDLVELYSRRGPEIFPTAHRWNWIREISALFGPKYSADGLERVFHEFFGDALLGEVVPGCKVLIPSYDLRHRKPLFMKSWRNQYAHLLMRDVAQATSSGPTYFPPKQLTVNDEPTERTLVDGGVFINSPAVSAYAEARRLVQEENPNQPEPEMLVLSLGTGVKQEAIDYDKASRWGRLGWIASEGLPLLNSMFDGVEDAADYQMRKFLSQGHHYARLQIDLQSASDALDDVTPWNISLLRDRASELIKSQHEEIERIVSFIEKF